MRTEPARKSAPPGLVAAIRTLQSLTRDRGAYMVAITTRVDGRTELEVTWPDGRSRTIERWDEDDDGEITLRWTSQEE